MYLFKVIHLILSFQHCIGTDFIAQTLRIQNNEVRHYYVNVSFQFVFRIYKQ